MCLSYRWRLERELCVDDDVIKTPTGQLRTNLKRLIVEKSVKQQQSLLAEIGLTPSSRTRVRVE